MSLSRQLRRAAERAQRKEERKALKTALPESKLDNSVPDSSVFPESEISNESEPCADSPEPSSPELTAVEPPAGRAGAGGPRTPEGKAISSLNNLKHGLAGKFRVLEGESQADFDAAQEALIAEHNPTTPTESELVRRMAEHAWLSRRAQNLVDLAVVGRDAHLLTVFLRYQTTNDRGFRACLNDLLRLRREQRAAAREFESQNQQTEIHETRVRLANARAAHLEVDTDIRSYVDAPLPGYSSIPLEQVKELFQSAIRSMKPPKEGKAAA